MTTCLRQLIEGIKAIRSRTGRPRKRPVKLHADKGHNYPCCHSVLRKRKIIARQRRCEGKADHFRGFARLACAISATGEPSSST